MINYTADNPENTCEVICANGMTRFPSKMPVGMAYVPMQCWEVPYDENTALLRGTLFPSLDLPFFGGEDNG